jgi:hypothetical protein
MPEQFLHGVEIVEIDAGTRPIQTVKSSVIGLIGTAAQGPVNEPVLITGSLRQAVEIFGEADGLGTIPDALDAIMDQTGAMVVVVNVCDPEVHTTTVPAANATFPATGILALPHRHVSAVTVTSPDGEITYVEGTDYTVDASAGTVQRLADGAIGAAAEVKVGYTYVDPSKVELADVIGGATATGYTGVHVLRTAENVVHVVPRILIAPGFTSIRPEGNANPVIAELQGIAERLRAIIVADGPNTTDADAITYREDWGSARIYVVDPWCLVWDTATNAERQQPASARVAGVIARMDNDRGFWWSPSNQIINGIIGTARAIEFGLSDVNSVANYLNENEVATIVRKDGYRLWGNRTCSADPKWAFLSVRRTADMVYESIEQAMLWAMDRPFSAQLLTDIAESVNAYLRRLVAQGALLGGSVWIDPELNTREALEAGQLTIDMDLEPPAPLEHLTIRAHRNNGYYEELVAKVAGTLAA